MLSATSQYDNPKDAEVWWESDSANEDGNFGRPTFNGTMPATPHGGYQGYFSPSTTEWISFILMSVGWFVLLTSLLGFWRVKRWERGIRQANEAPAIPTAGVLHNGTSRFLAAFGIPTDDDEDRGQNEEPPSEAEIRLTRELRASGLL